MRVLRLDRSVHRLGFTMNEVLVVLGCLGILATLLLAAVQTARSAALAASCRSRINQIGLAMQQYNTQFGVFPSCQPTTYSSDGKVGSAPRLSALVHLLPNLERADVYDRINFCYDRWVEPEQPAAAENINLFRCPADGTVDDGTTNFRVNTGGAFPSAYRNSDGYPDAGVGPFAVFNWTRAVDITDGLSHTAGVSERILADDDDGRFRAMGDYRNALLPRPPYPVVEQLVAICAVVDSSIPHISDRARWAYPGVLNTFYNHTTTPSSLAVPACIVGLGADIANSPKEHGGLVGASSYHSGGVNVTMMDGSTRFVSREIDPSVWWGMGTKSGGETF
ncbi:MAG: DUF1559 domain-containing protein [Planctomycetia bacterium]